MEGEGEAKQKSLYAKAYRLFLVRVSLKDLWKSSNINGLQAASKAFIHTLSANI